MTASKNGSYGRQSGARAFLACVGAWLREGAAVAALPPPLPPPTPLRRRRAKGEGGATELAVNRHGTAASRRWGFTRRAGAHSTARGGKTSPDGKMTDINRRRPFDSKISPPLARSLDASRPSSHGASTSMSAASFCDVSLMISGGDNNLGVKTIFSPRPIARGERFRGI